MTADDVSTRAAAPVVVPPLGSDGSHRSRRLRSGILSAIGSRGLAALAPLLLVPITFRYMGAGVFGLWVAILSLTSMAVWADLGLGNGLMSRLTPVLARRDHATARRLVATAYLVLASLAVVTVTVLLLLAPVLPWETLLNVSEPAAVALAPTVASISIGAFLVNVPLSLIQRIQYANQQVAQSNAWLAAGSLTSVVLAWLAVLADLGTATVVLSVALGPILSNIANTLWFFSRHRELVPARRDVGGESATSMVGLGGQFFVVSLLSATALNLDTLVVAHTRGLDEAAVFSVAYRLMTALGLLVTLINLPLWPANAEAIENGDTAWVLRTTRRMSLLSAAAVAVPGLLLTAFAPTVFRIWLGQAAVLPDRDLVIVLTLWWTAVAAAAPLFMVQNAVGEVRPQMVGWLSYLVLSLGLKVPAGLALGAVGVAAAGVVVYVVTMCPAAIWGYRSSTHRASARREGV